MKTVMLILFALLALGESVHVAVCYLRTLKGCSPWPISRPIHWIAAALLFAVWFLWNHFRMFE